MSAALALPSLLPGELRENGLVGIPIDLSFEAWEAALHNAEWLERASPWWVVDLLAFGRAKFHEDYSQALPTVEDDPDGIRQSKLKQAEWMADRWPAGTRVPEQSYSAHRAVAKLNRDDAIALLEMTDADGKRLTVRELVKRADAVEDAIQGKAVTVDGAPVEPADDLGWRPTKEQLTPDVRRDLEVRLSEMSSRHRVGFESGALWALAYANVLDCFTQEPAPPHDGARGAAGGE